MCWPTVSGFLVHGHFLLVGTGGGWRQDTLVQGTVVVVGFLDYINVISKPNHTSKAVNWTRWRASSLALCWHDPEPKMMWWNHKDYVTAQLKKICCLAVSQDDSGMEFDTYTVFKRCIAVKHKIIKEKKREKIPCHSFLKMKNGCWGSAFSITAPLFPKLYASVTT